MSQEIDEFSKPSIDITFNYAIIFTEYYYTVIFVERHRTFDINCYIYDIQRQKMHTLRET